MGVVQRHRGLPQDGEDLVARDRHRPGQHVIERGPVYEFHGDIGQVALLLHVVNGDDARVGTGCPPARARLTEQPLAQPRTLLRIRDLAQPDSLDG